MLILEKATEIVEQITGFSMVSITDVIGNVFISTVMFFLDLMLGL